MAQRIDGWIAVCESAAQHAVVRLSDDGHSWLAQTLHWPTCLLSIGRAPSTIHPQGPPSPPYETPRCWRPHRMPCRPWTCSVLRSPRVMRRYRSHRRISVTPLTACTFRRNSCLASGYRIGWGVIQRWQASGLSPAIQRGSAASFRNPISLDKGVVQLPRCSGLAWHCSSKMRAKGVAFDLKVFTFHKGISVSPVSAVSVSPVLGCRPSLHRLTQYRHQRSNTAKPGIKDRFFITFSRSRASRIGKIGFSSRALTHCDRIATQPALQRVPRPVPYRHEWVVVWFTLVTAVALAVQKHRLLVEPRGGGRLAGYGCCFATGQHALHGVVIDPVWVLTQDTVVI